MDPASITPDTVKRHAFILCLDVPTGTELGIDMKMWTLGNKFKGLKLIPPGPHLLYWQSVSKDKESGARVCQWFYLRSGQVIVLKWNPKWEGFFTDSEWAEEERAHYRDGALRMEFDTSLGPYPLDMHPQWQTLTSFITEQLMQKLNAVQSNVGFGTPFYTAVPGRRQVPQGLHGAALTRYGLDKSGVFDSLIQQQYGGESTVLLGELQYAFATFLIGQDYEGFEQWKALVGLLCNCERAMSERAALFVSCAELLHAQLLMVPEDFFIDPLSERNFLTVALRSFFELSADPATPPQLMTAAKQLKQLAEQRFAVSFSVSEIANADPTDEDAPVVVDT